MRQFLLTKKKDFEIDWIQIDILEFRLFCQPELEVTCEKYKEKEILLLDSLYDWEIPEKTNKEILNELIKLDTFEKCLDRLARYTGEYVLIYRNGNKIYLLNDMGAQSEIYYDTEYTTFGSQAKLIGKVIEIIPHTESDAYNFYTSEKFVEKKLTIGTTTKYKNVKHLLPNKYIDVDEKIVKRFYPTRPLEKITTNDAAEKVVRMMKGYIRAIAERKKIAIGVTAGYDSRVLFFASLNVECKYFVNKNKQKKENHPDLIISKRLAEMYGCPFEIIKNKDIAEELPDNVDLPIFETHKAEKIYLNHIYLGGGISEIARNYYGSWNNLDANDLAFINGYNGISFVIDEYKKWLNDKRIFQRYGYNLTDMFYWEERIGVWGAKGRTMQNAIGIYGVTPYCSRDLITTMLSTPRKDRNHYINKLYYKILLNMSKDALKIPINPMKKTKIIRYMIRFKVYDLYRYLGLKFRYLQYK